MSSTAAHEIQPADRVLLLPRAFKNKKIPLPKLNVPAEVEEAMGALAQLVIKNSISYAEATESFQTKLAFAAVAAKGGVVEQAAQLLRINYGWLRRVIYGTAFKGKSHK